MNALVIATAVLYVGIGLLAIIAPAIMASFVGLDALSRDATSEHRAMYGGMSLAIAGMLFATLNTPSGPAVQLMMGVMLLGLMGGRVLSALLDGPPSARMWSYAVLEAGVGVPLVLCS